MKTNQIAGLSTILMLAVVPQTAFAMHIMEGFLPPLWAFTWWLLFIPFLILAVKQLRQIVSQ